MHKAQIIRAVFSCNRYAENALVALVSVCGLHQKPYVGHGIPPRGET